MPFRGRHDSNGCLFAVTEPDVDCFRFHYFEIPFVVNTRDFNWKMAQMDNSLCAKRLPSDSQAQYTEVWALVYDTRHSATDTWATPFEH
jgi:hypothetical protein